MKKFTDQQKLFIKENYPIHGVKYCADYLNLQIKQVYDIAYKLKIKISTGGFQLRIFSKKDIEFIKNNYELKGAKFCAINLNFSPKRIINKAYELNIKYNPVIIIPKMGFKFCCICKKEIKLKSFSRNKKEKDGYCNTCKKCKRKYWFKNKKRLTKNYIIYRKKNKDKINAWSRQYVKHKMETDLNFKLRRHLGCRLYQALKGIKKHDNTLNLIGCSIEYLWNYLEKQFKPGMTKYNYGRYGWHIDHIIPCFNFDLTKKEEQYKCFHYTNLQPLWATTEIANKFGDFNCIGNLNKGSHLLKT